MDKDVDTPFGKMSKKADLILGILIFISAISYGVLKFKFPESEKIIDKIFLLIGGIGFGGFCCIYSLLHAPRQEANLQDESVEFEDIVKECFQDITAEKKNYKGSWSAVEEWKCKMEKKADELKQRTQTEGLTYEILEAEDSLIEELDMGLAVIQDGNNPLVVKEGKGRSFLSELSIFGKAIIPFLVIIPSIYLYLVLSLLEYGILLLTIAFSCFLFSYDIAPNSSGILAPFDFTQLRRIPFNFKNLLGIVLISGIGYFLNNWTYAQSGEVQLAITISLPILYGLIYYKLKHKKSVREI